jgi:hypothetical protein
MSNDAGNGRFASVGSAAERNADIAAAPNTPRKSDNSMSPTISIGLNARTEGLTRRTMPSLDTPFRDPTTPFLPLGGG